MRIKLIAAFLFISSIATAQLKSPGEFLGYELGTKFTPHFRIVNYFNHAAAAMPQMMKLEQYGETNEGRPLLLAIIASPENFSHLEDIRKNNLRLTGLLNDKPGDIAAPAIIWLSYNVHGNEPSSSEVSMKTLYELLSGANSQVKEWLKNTVVIIDPCLNPDGRDRYVNWFTQMVGKNANADPDSREHSEPWPGGRFNHYNFDLNRDWAWQTQIETQQRIKKYNEWMPEIHCDFHEQYPNSPYYFAPAAEPMHEVITSWQRDFQTVIGKNHAKYFDNNGWLYFTKEIFDLFYPAYGDTYPLYNGAIGMTYEQAGHSPGGLAVVKSDGDTLTLKDRIAHHFTTSMSTIEITSKNADRVVKEFKKFYDDAKNNLNAEYKTYVIEADGNKKAVLEKLFTRNNIAFVENNAGSFKFNAFNYTNGKTENVSVTDKTIIVLQANQPKSTLLKVLMEPKSKLSDSVTYDITGWAIPYAYGVQAYALKEKLSIKEDEHIADPMPSFADNSHYGYIVAAGADNGKLLAQLLKANVKVRFNEKPFTTGIHKFAAGSLIILLADNKERMQQVFSIAADTKTNLYAVPTGFVDKGLDFGSETVHFIKKPKVAMLTGNGVDASGAGAIWHFFEQQLDYPISLINAEEIGNVNWKNIDVLIMPGGYYKFLSDKETAADLKTWVKQGGRLIAIDNAVSQLASGDWGFKLKKAEEDKDKDKRDDSNYTELRRYENRERDGIVNNIPGAIYKVELDNSHPLAFGYPDFYFTLKQNDNIYEFMKDGWNVGVVRKNNQVAGFVGSHVKEKIKDGTVIGSLHMGNGSVTFFADDPVFRSFWENGKLLLSNAVFLVGQ
ncbi:MAG: M14 family metallopeptidase [Ferruginibacter sp.]